jgi:WD40 repeat protein
LHIYSYSDTMASAEAYPLVTLRKPQSVNEVGREDVALHHIFGADLTRINNLCFIEDDIIMYISGNAVIFENINSGSKDYLLGIDEIGVGAVAVHPSRTKFAVGGKGCMPNVYIYDYPSCKISTVLRGGTERAFASLSFSDEGDKLATVGGLPDYMLTVWDWQEQRIILHCKAFGQDVFSVRFSQDDERRLTTSGTGHIRFWKMVATFTGQKLQGSIGKFGKIELSDIAAFAELPDGKVISGTESGDLLLWEGNFIKCRFVNDNGTTCHKGNVHHCVLDRETGCVISAGADGYIRWWSFSLIDAAEVDSDHSMDFGLTPINEFYLGNGCGVKFFISNIVGTETRYVLLDTSGKLTVIRSEESTSGTQVRRGIPSNATADILSSFSAGAITGISANPKQHLVVTSGKDGFVRLWDYVNRTMLCYREFPSPVSCLTWAPVSVDETCRMVACGFDDGVVRVLSIFQREQGDFEMYKQMLFKPHNDKLMALSFSPDGKLFCTSGGDGTIFFFDTTCMTYDNSWIPLRFVSLGPKVVCESLSWRKNGSLICSCSDGVGRIVDVSLVRRLVGTDSSALEITSYEVDLPISLISLKIDIKTAVVAAAGAKDAERAPSPTKGTSSASGDGSEAPAEGSATPPSPEKAAQQTTTVQVPVRIGNIVETASGTLYAGAAYSQTNAFIHIAEDLSTFHEYPIGLHSTDGKKYLKTPAITSISMSRTNNFLFVGTKDGSVVTRPQEYVEVFSRVSAHNEQCGGVSGVATSFDDCFLLSTGRDGLLVVHRLKPSTVLQAAEPLAKDIRAGVYDTQTEKVPPKVQTVEPKHLFKVSKNQELENFGDLPSKLCDDEDFLGVLTGAEPPEGREAAELEKGTYSIQDAKLKSEDDARKLTADEKKENVRKLVRQLQREYTDVAEKVGKVPEKVRVKQDELVVDMAYFALLARQGDGMAAEAHLDCEYPAAVSSAIRAKVTERLMDKVIVEDIALKGFRSKNPPTVHSLRTRDLDPSVWAALESIRDMVRQEEVEESKARASQASLGEQMKQAKQGVAGGGSTATPAASVAGTQDPLNAGGSVDLDSGVHPHNSNLNSTRSEQRKGRKEELKGHSGSKPREDEDDVRDVQAIEVAERTIGSYRLKIADDYQVPEEQRVNADKKKRQIVMLEDSIMSLKMQFNERFLALRSLKKQIVEDIALDHTRVAEIDSELEPGPAPRPKICSHKNDPKEYPDDRDEVTPAELEHFKAAAKGKAFDKIIPMANSIVTGTKTLVEVAARPKSRPGQSPPKKFSDTVTSQFQSFIDGNSTVGNSTAPEGGGGSAKPAAANMLLAKYYPDDDGLDYLESNVAVLIAAKENLGQINRARGPVHQQITTFLTVERQRLLLHERECLVTKTHKHTTIFDEAVDELRLDRHALSANLKQAELKLLVLLQEYMQLLTFETRDSSLQQKSAKCMREKKEIISGTLELLGKMEVKQDELKSWTEKAEQVLASFHQMVPSSYPYAEQLLKIFKKKIKRNKHTGGGDNGDEEEFEEDESEGDDDDDDMEDEEVDDACPVGCDMVIYDKVLDLREKRLDIEEVTSDVVKIVDDLKKSTDRLRTREKQIDKDAKNTESEIQQFQLQKQVALNQIDVYLPIHLSQVYAFTSSGSLSGPKGEGGEEAAAVEGDASEGSERLSRVSSSDGGLMLIPEMTSKSHVFMNGSSLGRLQERIGELHSEIDAAKHDSRRLHREKGAFSKQREAQKSKIDVWKEKVDELMSMKFGRIIDLDELEKGSDRTVEDSAQRDLERQESRAQKELAKTAAEAFELKSHIAEATKRNTDLLQKVADLAENKLALTRELNAPTGGNASTTQGVALDETSDRVELKAFSNMQLREIDALRNEVTALRRKDAPLLLSTTLPNPPVARSSSARNPPDGGLFPPIASARNNSSR